MNQEKFDTADLAFAVVHKGEIKYFLNRRLAETQNLSDATIHALVQCHVKKLEIFDQMNATDVPVELIRLAVEVANIEYMLQELWGFSLDANFHEWYLVPKCTCPKLDNEDWKGTSRRIYDLKCPIHGHL